VSWTPELILVCTFLAATALAGLPLIWFFEWDRGVAERLNNLRDSQSRSARKRFQQSRRNAQDTMSASLARFGSRLLPSSEEARLRIAERFLHAGIYSATGPSLFTSVRFIAGIGIPVVVLLLGRFALMNELAAALAAGGSVLIGFVGTSAWLQSRIARRQRHLRKSLPDFLDLMGTCLQAGQSFEAALSRVTEELRTAHSALAVELMIVQREMTLGSTPARALRAFADRSGLDVIRQMATLVDQSQRLGSSMTESLRVHSEMLRTQRSQRAETLAHRAGVKILFPTLVFIFPPVLVILAGPAAIDLHDKFVQQEESSSPDESGSRRR